MGAAKGKKGGENAQVHFEATGNLLRVTPSEDENQETVTVEARPESPEEYGDGDSVPLLQNR